MKTEVSMETFKMEKEFNFSFKGNFFQNVAHYLVSLWCQSVVKNRRNFSYNVLVLFFPRRQTKPSRESCHVKFSKKIAFLTKETIF